MKEIILDKNTKNSHLSVWKNEEITYILNDKNEENSDISLKINLEWDYSSVFLRWRIFSNLKNKKKYNLKINSLWKNQKIKIDLKWVADWESEIIFDWWAIIWKNSIWAEVEVLQKIILFSNKSKASAIPVLDVKTDKINSASHSTSISPFEKEKLFYLWTRWICKNESKKLLFEWFLK